MDIYRYLFFCSCLLLVDSYCPKIPTGKGIKGRPFPKRVERHLVPVPPSSPELDTVSCSETGYLLT